MPQLSRAIQSNFSSGLLDDLMVARGDIAVYNQGCKQLENVRLFVQGGLGRRPGTLYLNDVGQDARIEDFTFSLTQRYIFAFYNNAVKVFSPTGTLVVTITGQPWTNANVDQISITQRADVMFIAHEDFELVQIRRVGATSFIVTNFEYEAHSTGWPRYLPFFPYQNADDKLTPSATTGTITVSTNNPYFNVAMVGDIIQYEAPGTTGYKQIELTAFTSSTAMTGVVRKTLGGTAASTQWEHQAFSSYWGWPKTVEFHTGRLWFGGSKNLPGSIFSSKSGLFFNFDTGDASDDDAIAITIDSDKVNEIKHIKSARHLQVFTDQGEFYLPESEASPITPKTVSIRKQTPYGSGDIKPYVFDISTMFVQRTGRVVRELLWDEIQRGYTANAISLPISTLLNDIQDIAILYGTQERPEQYAFFVNVDGSMMVYSSVRTENIRGWMKWTTDGKFKSVCQTGDEVFFLIERDVNGTATFFLEKMSELTTLDCAVEFTSGSETLNLTGAAHLANDVAKVVTGYNGEHNKYDIGEFNVDASGNISLGVGLETDIAYIGIHFNGIIETLSPEIATKQGRMTAEVRRIVSCTIISDTTLDYNVNGTELVTRNVNDDMSKPPSSITGAKKFYLTGYSRRPTVTIINDHALPFTILAISMDVMY